MDVLNRKDSILGYIAIFISIAAAIIFFGAYFLGSEMALFIMIVLIAALIGIILGLIGLVLSLVRKRTKIRTSVWGIILNAAFIVLLIIMLFFTLGGP